MGIEAEMAALAVRQHGVVGIDQARSLGADFNVRERLVASGRWAWVTDRVLLSRSAPRSRGRDLVVAVLDEGSDETAVSHKPAAAWWRVPGFSIHPVTVATTQRARHRDSTWERHVVRSLPDRWCTVLDGVRIVRPELLIMQLCATVHPDRAERALDNAWRMRLLSARSLAAFLGDHAARGRNGIALLRTLVDARGPDYRPPDSGLEGRVEQILEGAGMAFRRQVDLGDGDNWIGRCDFVAADRPLVLEVQSAMYHSALLDATHDAARRAALMEAGFQLVEVTDAEVWNAPQLVRARVQAAYRATPPRSVPLRTTRASF
jgi:very-short-patch-repair endonuclease